MAFLILYVFKTLLHVAVEKELTEIIKLLLSNPNINACEIDNIFLIFLIVFKFFF